MDDKLTRQQLLGRQARAAPVSSITLQPGDRPKYSEHQQPISNIKFRVQVSPGRIPRLLLVH